MALALGSRTAQPSSDAMLSRLAARAPAVLPRAAQAASIVAAATRAISSSAALAASSAASPLSPYPVGRSRHLVPPSAQEIAAGTGYAALTSSFRWPHLEANLTHYNIGVDISDKWARDPSWANKPALIYEETDSTGAPGGEVVTCSFAQSAVLSDLLGYALQHKLGLLAGDRVAILMSQSIETALVHTAVYKTGAIAVPLFILFGPEALEYRLADSGAKVVCVEPSKLEEVLHLKSSGKLPELKHIVVAPPLAAMRFVETAASMPGASTASSATQLPTETVAGVHHLSTLLADAHSSGASSRFRAAHTKLDEPALIIYTSGTTGPPKGALHAHRVLLGHMPGVEFPHEFFPQYANASAAAAADGRQQGGDLFWTPADWAWIGGLIDVLLPSLHHGVPVYACRFKKFDPELAFSIIERRGIRNMFMPPTALKLMRTVNAPEKKYPNMSVRSIGSGGESLGESLLEWGRQTFNGVTINEFYGQTECNLVLGNCSTLFPTRAGSMGKPIPGHIVHVVDLEGKPLPDGEVGNIGVRAPHPVMMLRYWNKPAATLDKYAGNYLLTGDLAKRDADGYFHFFGRGDDVIKSSGYRIGPAEIEECLMRHPAVQNVAAVGVPDELRGEKVKVYIVLRPGAIDKLRAEAPAGAAPSDATLQSALTDSIQAHVKGKLAAYEVSLHSLSATRAVHACAHLHSLSCCAVVFVSVSARSGVHRRAANDHDGESHQERSQGKAHQRLPDDSGKEVRSEGMQGQRLSPRVRSTFCVRVRLSLAKSIHFRSISFDSKLNKLQLNALVELNRLQFAGQHMHAHTLITLRNRLQARLPALRARVLSTRPCNHL